jgi:hypothetical protein
MRFEGVKIGPLSREGRRIIEYMCREVPDRDDVVSRAQPLYKQHQIEPQVASPILVVEPVVQVEAVDVGNDAGHAAP